MLNTDFKDKNAELTKIMKERAKLLLEEKKRENSNYFPFIGSDQVEKNRMNLNASLRNDL